MGGLKERGAYLKITVLKGELNREGGLIERGLNRAFTVSMSCLHDTTWISNPLDIDIVTQLAVLLICSQEKIIALFKNHVTNLDTTDYIKSEWSWFIPLINWIIQSQHLN